MSKRSTPVSHFPLAYPSIRPIKAQPRVAYRVTTGWPSESKLCRQQGTAEADVIDRAVPPEVPPHIAIEERDIPQWKR